MAENLTYTKKISGLFASFSILILLGVNLFTTMRIDVSTLVFVFVKVLPVSVVMWYLGYLIGKILDNPKSSRNKR